MDKKQANVRQAKTLNVYARMAFPRVRTVCIVDCGWMQLRPKLDFGVRQAKQAGTPFFRMICEADTSLSVISTTL